MKTSLLPNAIEFYHQRPINFLLLERRGDGVVVRAAYDNFSAKRKSFFIKELAAEGFIADYHQWFSEPDDDGFRAVKWIIDDSWVGVPAKVQRQAARAVGGIFLVAGLLWLLVIALMLSQAPGGPRF